MTDGKGKDFYRVLGVSCDANKKSVREAYLRKAKLHHPDVASRHKSASESQKVFQEIQEAYRVLSDPDLRREYDSTGNDRSDWEAKRSADDESFQDFLNQQRESARQTGGVYGLHGRNFDVDAWEQGHGIGRYGTGPESIYTKYSEYFREEAKRIEMEKLKRTEKKMTKDQRFWARRNAQRHRKVSTFSRRVFIQHRRFLSLLH